MGASESLIVISQDKSTYENQECLKSFSSDLYENVLHLYKISSIELQHGDYNGVNEVDMILYVVVLFNPNKSNQCFSLFHTDNPEEGEQKYKYVHYFILILVPVFM